MKKLESLMAFQEMGLSNDAMFMVRGGKVAQSGGTETGAGTACVPTSSSASGCCSYSSDFIPSTGGFNFSPANGTMANSDVNQPC